MTWSRGTLRFSTLAGTAVAAAAVPLIVFGAGVALAEDGSPGGGDSTSSDSSSGNSSSGDSAGSDSSTTDSGDGNSGSTGSRGDTSSGGNGSDGNASDSNTSDSNASDSDTSDSNASESDAADSAGESGTDSDDAGAEDGSATETPGDGSTTEAATPSTTRPHGSNGDHEVVPTTPGITPPPATTNIDTNTDTDSTANSPATQTPRTETVAPAPDPEVEVPVIGDIVDSPTAGVPDPEAVPVMTPLAPAAVVASDIWAPNAFATDPGSDPLPVSSLAVVQSSTLGVGATPRSSTLFGLPVVVIPSTPRNLNDPVWETEWEAFNSSVVAWVPGVGNTLATISVVIDTYQLAAAIGAGDHAEVSDEIGDLAGDIIGIEFGQGIGTQARYLIHLYISDAVATWIVGDPTPVATV